ncbi:hypothetical protein AB0G87_12040 [Streptomyces asoensis]|uniref:DUF7919 family protein n=1 Tax=Streptomyces asoensis TaxID=249586 RepID=UPI0033F97AC4
MEYRDLSIYDYSTFPLSMRCIGWLGNLYGVQGSNEPAMTVTDVNCLTNTSQRLGSVMLGVHDCEFCPAGSAFAGNGEYRYYMGNGEVYSAPMMLLHYVEKHGYRLPAVFRKELAETRALEWDWRAERLSAIMLDEAQDIDFRCEAAIDLANWSDVRALDALWRASRDEVLVDAAGMEIGRSLGILRIQDEALTFSMEGLSAEIREGVEEVLWNR